MWGRTLSVSSQRDRRLREVPRAVWLATGLFVVAFVIFAAWVWRPSFWVDEYLTQTAISQRWPDLIHRIVTIDPGPGPYYLAMKIWSAVSAARLDATAVGDRRGRRRGAVRHPRQADDRHSDRRLRGRRAVDHAERIPLRAGEPSVRVRPAVQRAGGDPVAHLADAERVRRGQIATVVGRLRVVGIAAAIRDPRLRPALILAAVWVVVPTVLLLAAKVAVDLSVMRVRYVLFMMPGVALLVALGLRHLAQGCRRPWRSSWWWPSR